VKAIGQRTSYTKWKVSPGTMKIWLTQAAGDGRTPYGEWGLLEHTGLLTLLGEDWSPPGKNPRNSYLTNLDGQCQGGPEGENYRKLPGLVKCPKTKKKSGGVLW